MKLFQENTTQLSHIPLQRVAKDFAECVKRTNGKSPCGEANAGFCLKTLGVQSTTIRMSYPARRCECREQHGAIRPERLCRGEGCVVGWVNSGCKKGTGFRAFFIETTERGRV